MKYIKYEDLLNHKEIRIIKVELKPNAKMTEEEWFRFMVSGNILQVADTIEELCDEFVVEDNYDFAIFNNLKLARQTKGTCYGAVWCEWGLKYVARINSKGVLELL